jgi:transcriptional regulator with XRE-family HTH domain
VYRQTARTGAYAGSVVLLTMVDRSTLNTPDPLREWHTRMADFADVVRRHMNERGLSLRATAKAAHYDPGLLSKVLSGRRPHSPYLADRLDRALGAGGEIKDAAVRERPPPRPAPKLAAKPGQPSGAVLALQAAMTGDAAGLEIAGDGLAELVRHYARAIAVAPSAAAYDELLSARTFAGTLLGRAPRREHPDLTVTAGWLSSLLAVSAADLGDHAASIVWCADTERRARSAGFPELLGWAALTRSLIAYYQGDPARSAAAARRGQAEALPGSVAYAKLAAHEMRCAAMLGDFTAMADARTRAAAAMTRISPDAEVSGVYSVRRDSDPPYAATSLLLASQYAEAAEVTRRLLGPGRRPQARQTGNQPTSYARTLLILALSVAGLGDVDEAASAGAAALESGRMVWPTLVLAGKLAGALDRRSPGSEHAEGFRARYIDAADRLALPAARTPGEGT